MDQYSYLQSHIGPYNNYIDPGLNDKNNENNKMYFMGAQQQPPQQQIMQPQQQQIESGSILGPPDTPFHPNMGMVHNSQLPMYHQNYGNPYIPYVQEQIPYGSMHHQNSASVIQMPQTTIPQMPIMGDNIGLSPQVIGLPETFAPPLMPPRMVTTVLPDAIVEPIVTNPNVVASVLLGPDRIHDKKMEISQRIPSENLKRSSPQMPLEHEEAAPRMLLQNVEPISDATLHNVEPISGAFALQNLEPISLVAPQNAEPVSEVPTENTESILDGGPKENVEIRQEPNKEISMACTSKSIESNLVTTRIPQEIIDEPPIEIPESPPQSIPSSSSSSDSPESSSDESPPQYTNKKKRKRIRLLNEDDSDDEIPESERLELQESRSPEVANNENISTNDEKLEGPKSIFHNVVVIPAECAPSDGKRKKKRVLDSDEEDSDFEPDLKDIGLDGENAEDLNQTDFLMNENVDGDLESIQVGQIGEIVPLENPIVYSGDEDKEDDSEEEDDDEDMYVKEIDDENDSIEGVVKEIDDDNDSVEGEVKEFEDDANSIGSGNEEDDEKSENMSKASENEAKSGVSNHEEDEGSDNGFDAKSLNSDREYDARSINTDREDDEKSIGQDLEDDAKSMASDTHEDVEVVRPEEDANQAIGLSEEEEESEEGQGSEDDDYESDVPQDENDKDSRASNNAEVQSGDEGKSGEESRTNNADVQRESEGKSGEDSEEEKDGESTKKDSGSLDKPQEKEKESAEKDEETTEKDEETTEKDEETAEKDNETREKIADTVANEKENIENNTESEEKDKEAGLKEGEIAENDHNNKVVVEKDLEKEIGLGVNEIIKSAEEKEKANEENDDETQEETQEKEEDDSADKNEDDEDNEEDEESDSDVIVQEIPDDDVQEILDSEEEQQLGENKKTDEGELHDASVNYLASAELEDLPLSVRLKQERQARKQQRRAERRQMRRNEMLMKKRRKERLFDPNEDLNNPFGANYSSSSTDEEDIPNEIYFGTPDRVAMSYSYKGRGRPKSKKRRYNSSSDTEDYYRRKHPSMRYLPSMGSKKKRKRDRFYDKSRDIPNDIYFNANVPLHVLHSFGASSDSDEPKATPKYTPSYISSRKPHPKYSSKPSSSSSSQYRKIDVTAHPPSERLNQLKEYLKIAGLKKVKLSRIWEGCKTNDERADAILRLFRRKGMIGEPTAAKCRELKLKLQTKREIAELDTSVIIDSEEGGRTRRSAKKPEVEPINPEGIETLNKMKTIVDSDSD